MDKNSVTPGSKVKPGSKTDWKKVIGQTEGEVVRNSQSDSDSPILKDKKYYKPGKTDQKSST